MTQTKGAITVTVGELRKIINRLKPEFDNVEVWVQAGDEGTSNVTDASVGYVRDDGLPEGDPITGERNPVRSTKAFFFIGD